MKSLADLLGERLTPASTESSIVVRYFGSAYPCNCWLCRYCDNASKKQRDWLTL